ncbi:hypothetical protein J8F10_30825 [Gemmata sp. G18]|uniref:Glycosyltransferase RgtA/B/C/D-like domain-containing protein n=1 Tax=Gemmata palustris TaxID=2822762 RepID=A0ABS5C110_9BACT|nr:hypothetical protein [Gemmata palustris]MBP3959662.1 hypothetical protein [Gemmata palustris]
MDEPPISNPAREPNQSAGWWGWVVVGALVAIEVATFVSYARREIAWAFPGYYDQTAYITQAYGIVHDASNRELFPAIRSYLAAPHATGILLPIQGAIHCVILGHDRVSVLSVNFAHFVLFQCALVATILWLTRNWPLALAGFGLTLTLKTVFLPAGSAFDFRMDFSAFCLYGVLLCALIRSRVLLNPRGAAVVGACASVVVLFRFITAVYIGGILSAIGAGLLVWRFTRADAEARERAARRLRGWVIATGFLVTVTWPVLINQREAIKNYYVVGHITSSEKEIRAAEEGVRQWSDAARYYPRSVVCDHTGPAFWWAAGILGAVGSLGFVRPGARVGSAPQRSTVFPVAVLGFGVPFVVLNMGAIKSPVVGDVLLPALIWIVLAPLAASAQRAPRGLLSASAGATLLLGTGTFLTHAATPALYTKLGDDGRRGMQLIQDLIDTRIKKGLHAPEVFNDANSHDITGLGLQVLEFERHGRWAEYRDGTGIFAWDEGACLRRLEECDFAILKGVPPGHFKFPYDEAMEKMRPALRAYCEANMTKIGEYHICGRTVTTYARKSLRTEGITTDGWVAPEGFRFTGTLGDLKGCQRIELNRSVMPNHLGRVPEVVAEVELPNRPRKQLPATAASELRSVSVEWEPVDLPAETPVTIHLRFTASFTPAERGLSANDSRALVLHVGPQPRVVLHPRDRDEIAKLAPK